MNANLINRSIATLSIFMYLLFCQACLAAAEPVAEELDEMGQEAVTMLLKHRPDLAGQLEQLPGYAVIGMTTTKIPGIGSGSGFGVIIDNRNQQSSYIKVTQIEVGGGIGAQTFKAVILLQDASLVDRMIKGGLHYESSAELAAASKTTDSEGSFSTQSGKGYKVFKLTESGAIATITIRALHGKPYLADSLEQLPQ